MSRPPYSVINDSFPMSSANPSHYSNVNSVHNVTTNPNFVPNVCTPRTFDMNSPRHNTFATNDFFQHGPHSSNVPYRYPCPANTYPNQMPVPPGQFPPPSYSSPHPTDQNWNSRPMLNPFQRNPGSNDLQKMPPHLPQNVSYGHVQGTAINANDPSRTFYPCPPTDRNIAPGSESRSHSTMFSGSSDHTRFVPPTLNPISAPMQHYGPLPPPVPVFNSNSYSSPSNDLQNTLGKKEMELLTFLTKFSCSEERSKSQITVPEFRSVLIAAFSLLKLLFESKSKLSNLLEADEKEWNLEVQSVTNLQKQLSELCSLISTPTYLNVVMKKLKLIKKKRELKKKSKLNQLSEKIKRQQNRKERSQEIDKYLDDIKEKNSKLKREAEMKKEADYILSEVRKKIHEAKRTIEKIKLFEKLRNARQANAVQRGLHVLPDHNAKFDAKVRCLRDRMLGQLADYEAEERALKVMLETEQEGQREEETRWKVKKLRALQHTRKANILEALFGGNAEEPTPSDPLYLFHKYHTSANSSIESLVQIRHQWDCHLSEEGEAVPVGWVVPPAAPNDGWPMPKANHSSGNMFL